MEKDLKYYIAYGSNLNIPQMKRRCPGAYKMFPVTLPGYRLAFRGRKDGTGVATVIPEEGNEVKCLLWLITEACEKALDVYEGCPVLYTKQNVVVKTPSGKDLTAMVYIMTPGHVPALPGEAYFKCILNGFIQNEMDPESLYDAIERTFKEVNRTSTRQKEVTNRKAGRRKASEVI